MTFIERVQVDADGFLSGLDVAFERGLNVIIGARGTGKTSLIELIRYCLEAEAFTDKARIRGEQQAVSTLDGGSVTVTLRDGTDRVEITRDSDGNSSRRTPHVRTTVIAQSEMEAIGASPTGRLRLIDRLLVDADRSVTRERKLTASARSLTIEVAVVRAELAALADDVLGFSTVDSELAAARASQELLLTGSTATVVDQKRLIGLQALTHETAQSAEQIAEFARTVDATLALARSAERQLRPEASADSDDPRLLEARASAALALRQLREALATLNVLSVELMVASEAIENDRASTERESRELRQRLDLVQEGISQVSRTVTALEGRRGQLTALEARIREVASRIQGLSTERDSALSEIESIRVKRLHDRTRVAHQLNAIVGPAVRIDVRGSEKVEQYEAAIVAGLRGSGLHYNTLAPILANAVAPRELLDWIESGDASGLATAIGVNLDRAVSVLQALRGEAAAEISTVEVDDAVEIELLDGPGYKPASELSIGQRCTAVMPLLLAMHGDPLLIDQPEDHLDNAFVVSTLIAALLRRSNEDQLIFSSHNANIPVLGAANRVLVMESDGRRGGAAFAGPLEHPDIVSAITRIMEGGSEAFKERARFYSRGPNE